VDSRGCCCDWLCAGLESTQASNLHWLLFGLPFASRSLGRLQTLRNYKKIRYPLGGGVGAALAHLLPGRYHKSWPNNKTTKQHTYIILQICDRCRSLSREISSTKKGGQKKQHNKQDISVLSAGRSLISRLTPIPGVPPPRSAARKKPDGADLYPLVANSHFAPIALCVITGGASRRCDCRPNLGLASVATPESGHC
jgi:hypothetical protein